MLAKAVRVLNYTKARLSSSGPVETLYALAGFITYPRGGFPRHEVDVYMQAIAQEIAPGALMLDAGAGSCPYKPLFKHARYQSCEFQSIYEAVHPLVEHTFFCDLESIPVAENTYDAIVCAQVLEHVKRPQEVVREFYRVLKPGGRLFVTVPQCHGLHMQPYNYFNFLSFGLTHMFEEAGFHEIRVKPLGGIFSLLGTVLLRAYETAVGRLPRVLRPLYVPLHVLMRVAFLPLAIALLYLDRLDDKRTWTVNYGCSGVKGHIGATR